MKRIKNVSERGINYINDTGEEKFVDFEECNRNWIQYKKRIENLTDIELAKVKNSDKYIGQRDICAKPKFIEFFTRPFTRFEFEEVSNCGELEEMFHSIQTYLTLAGWNTIDLS